MRKIVFASDCYYHIYNRGVDKREVFVDKSDYYRFIHDLYVFNNENGISSPGKRWNGRISRLRISNQKRGKLLAGIVCFCLMPNHYHLILKQRKENGISGFMHKIGTGYTMYFNKRYERTGSLFENRFKAIPIERDEYLMHLSRYIHMNPIKLLNSSSQKKNKNTVQNCKTVESFLENYKWSSYLDYIGRPSFPSLINKGIVSDYFNTFDEYKKFALEHQSVGDTLIEDFIIEE